jgi:DNA-binding transcriptional ArsR family regulator
MFTEEVVPVEQRAVTSAPSLAADLSWLLSVAARPSMQARYPKLAEMFNGREDLADRVRRFWEGVGSQETCFTEMQILVHHAGATTETDPDALWRAIKGAVATIAPDFAMPSECHEERQAYDERLRRLKESPELLREYMDLLQEVWAPVDETWQQALPIIEEAGHHVVAQYERGRSLEILITPGCDILRDRLPEIVARVEAGEPLLFIPCLFFGSSMYLEFSNQVIIGTGVGQGDVVSRTRAESMARRLKAVADPTRLAILCTLATASSSVGELAVLFRLAQPTVSMHVKVLRQSGLVHSERVAGRLRLSADPAAVESLLTDLRAAVLQEPEGASTTGSDLMPATVDDSTRSGVPVTV